MVLLTAVTVAVLVVVFVGIFPRVADYSQVWSAIQQMPTAYVAGLVVATVVYLAAYVWPLRAALPGLGYGPGFVVGQTAFAISNAVPAGGAVGLGVQYGMLDSYGFGAGAAASAIAIVSVFNVFATLVMPVIGVVALLASGEVTWTDLLVAAIGVLAVGVAVVAFAVVLRSERGARTVGRWADRLVNPLTRRPARVRSVDLTGKLLNFRSSVVDVMQARWVQVTLSTLVLQFTSWAILALALRGLQAGAGDVTVTWTEALAAFSFARVASAIPITPGWPRHRGCRPGGPAHQLWRDQQPGPGRRPRVARSVLPPPVAARRLDVPLVAGHGRPPKAACRRAQPDRLVALLVAGPRSKGRWAARCSRVRRESHRRQARVPA